MVGMHWFMWMDYGKHWDYPPDMNVGLVTNDESRSYSELEEELQKTHEDVEATHLSPITLKHREKSSGLRVLSHFTPCIDGVLAEWPASHKFFPQEVVSLLKGNDVKQTYYLSRDDNFLYLGGDISDSHLDYPGRDYVWQADYLSVYLGPIADGRDDNENYALFYVYPTGGGMDGKEPYVGGWRDFDGFQPVRAKVSRRLKAGGYTIEAAIPLKVGTDMSINLAMNCRLKMVYQNANEIYRTIVRSKIVFRP
ncbi:MAG: sugar-binding protein, partial [Desulfoferrobacter sp.]